MNLTKEDKNILEMGYFLKLSKYISPDSANGDLDKFKINLSKAIEIINKIQKLREEEEIECL